MSEQRPAATKATRSRSKKPAAKRPARKRAPATTKKPTVRRKAPARVAATSQATRRVHWVGLTVAGLLLAIVGGSVVFGMSDQGEINVAAVVNERQGGPAGSASAGTVSIPTDTAATRGPNGGLRARSGAAPVAETPAATSSEEIATSTATTTDAVVATSTEETVGMVAGTTTEANTTTTSVE